MQVDSITTLVDSAPGLGFRVEKLKCDALLSNVAFNFNLRRYIMAADLRAFIASSASAQRPIVSRPGARAALGTSADMLAEGYKDFDPLRCQRAVKPGVQCRWKFTRGCPHFRCGVGQHCPDITCPEHKGKAAADAERAAAEAGDAAAGAAGELGAQ